MDSDSDDDEDITGLISKPPTKYIPPARYISRHRNSIKSDLSRSKSAHLTLGVPNVPLNPPEEYLKKQSRTIIKRDDINHKHYHRPDYQHKLPSWEPIKRSSKSINGDDKNTSTMNSVDFKKRNISNVKKSQPSMPRMYYVDDRRGSSFPLLSSGLVPRHISYDKSNSKSNQIKKITNENKTIRSSSTDRGTVENASQRRSTSESKKSQNLNTTNRESTRDNSDKLINTKKKQTSVSKNDSKKLNNNTKKNSHQSKIVKSANDKLHGVMKNNNQSTISKSANEKLHNVMKKNDQSTILKSDNERSMSLENNKKRLSSSARRSTGRESNCHFVTEEERAELLLGMKNKWDELMKRFQSLPFLSDTPPKAKRKSMLEEQLKQLEKDIDNIQRHPYIYVYDNDNN